MKTDDDQTVLGCMLALASFLLAVTYTLFVGLAVSMHWNWHAVGAFDIPAITWKVGVGIYLMHYALRVGSQVTLARLVHKDDDDRLITNAGSSLKLTFTSTVLQAVALAISWAVS